jgi:hypothetical protein
MNNKKEINIAGTHNKYLIKKTCKIPQREKNKIILSDNLKSIEYQKQIISNIFTQDKCSNINIEDLNILEKEIKKKLSSYKSQDKKNNKFDEPNVINYENIIEKLLSCKQKCYYCSVNMLLLYDDYRCDNQWTLDRIDNNIGHNTNNVVISCLKCNLERRNTNQDKYNFTKNMSIKKLT